MPVPAEVPPLTPPVTAVDAVVQPPASEPLPASQAFDLELRPTALRKVGLPAGPCGEAPAAAGGQRARRPPCYSLAWLLAGAACHAGAARMRCWPCGLVCAGNASFTAGPHACPVLRRMKLRVRTVHGETLKVEAEKSDSIAGFIAKLDLPPALTTQQGNLCLSLNKKDMLISESTLEANGIRGGDLVHLLLRNGSEVAGASSSRPQASSSATAVGSGTPTPPPAPPRSNLYGLPTTAPTSDSGMSAAATGPAGLVRDSAGRVWQESVLATSKPKPQGASTVEPTQPPPDPEEARRQRLLAIERRLGKSAVDEPEPVSGTQKRERPDGFAGDPGAVRSKQPPTCHDMLRALHRRNNLGPLSATDAWVLGLHFSIAKCGYKGAHGEDSFLTQAWKGKGGSYTLSYLAQVDGCKAQLTLKCVEMGAEIIVHASLGQGHTARANMRCVVSEMATSRRDGGLPELTQGGEPLFHMVRAKLIAALERQGVSARSEAGGGGTSSATPDAGSGDVEMTEIDSKMIGGAGYPGLVDQAQTFAVFREGLRVAKSLPEVQTAMLHEAPFLVLSVHVLMCCAGLSPERESSAPPVPAQSAPEADSCASMNPEWELVEGGAGQADWELVDKDSVHEERSQKRPGQPGGAAAAGEGRRLLPEGLRNNIAALPESWQRLANGGSHAVRYVASVEGGSATVLLKAVQLNGRLFLHARIVAPQQASRGSHHFSAAPTARCVLVQSQMVAKIGGECVVTDAALEQLIVLVSRRLLVPIGRAVRAVSALHTASPGDDDKAGVGIDATTHAALSAPQGAASGVSASDSGEASVGGERAADGGGPHLGSRVPRVSFGALYAELKTHVLAHLPGRVLGVVSCASRKLNSLAMNDLLWGFLVVRDFGKGFGAAPLPVKVELNLCLKLYTLKTRPET